MAVRDSEGIKVRRILESEEKLKLTTQQKAYATQYQKNEVAHKGLEESTRRFFLMVNEDIMAKYARGDFNSKEELFIWTSLLKHVMPTMVNHSVDASDMATKIKGLLDAASSSGVTPLRDCDVAKTVIIQTPKGIMDMMENADATDSALASAEEKLLSAQDDDDE